MTRLRRFWTRCETCHSRWEHRRHLRAVANLNTFWEAKR